MNQGFYFDFGSSQLLLNHYSFRGNITIIEYLQYVKAFL